MAKNKTKPAPGRMDPNAALEQLEMPKMNWKVIAQIGVAVAVLWVLAGMLSVWVGIWGFVVAGVLTAVVLGFALYVWRLMRKSTAIVEILKGAQGDEGRKAAIAALSDKGANDVMAAVAQAQLVAQEDPKEAIRILEGIDLKKAPKILQNDVRSQLALMYLLQNRTSEARPLVDEIKLDGQAQPKQKALYAAVMAECWARTGKEDEAVKVLEDYSPDDPAYGEIQAFLWRAQVFTWLKVKKKGRARTAMMRLAKIDPNQLGAFLQKGAHPDLKRLATEVLQREGYVPNKPQMKIMR
ncbi:MAG: tetratricopeptide repeat protein [Myxococcales bacterium]|nr:tetratricopeptide repeat protein [Myxococcales bacterium]